MYAHERAYGRAIGKMQSAMPRRHNGGIDLSSKPGPHGPVLFGLFEKSKTKPGVTAAGNKDAKTAFMEDQTKNGAVKNPLEATVSDDAPEDQYGEFLKATGANPGLKQEASKMAIQKLAEAHQKQDSVDKDAILSRMGGKHTLEGLQMAEQNAHLNAQDRLRSRALIGLGGTMAGYQGRPPPTLEDMRAFNQKRNGGY